MKKEIEFISEKHKKGIYKLKENNTFESLPEFIT